MKYVLALIMLCACKHSPANQIDSLKTNADVINLIISADSDIREHLNNYPISVLSSEELATAATNIKATYITNIKPWVKVDLNDDGLTDMIVYTRYYGLLVVMDTGKGHFNVIRIKSFPNLAIVGPAKVNGHTFLLAEHMDCGNDENIKNGHDRRYPDTLVYKFGSFLEVNNNPAHYDISSVTIFTGLCALGVCPSYKLVIEPNGQARYVAGSRIPKQGVFTSEITPGKTAQVMGLINYIKVKNMEDRYQSRCIMDGGGWQLVVAFKDGSEKKIVDFNGGGTFGLEAIYPLLNNIANTQAWKQIK
jgi:hypothetical protein